MSRKLPIRTYQRKKTPNQPTICNSAQIHILPKADDIPKKQHGIDNIEDNKISEDSLHCDPFESTFDRIAKDAVVPPIPFDCINDKSWYDSSFDISNEKKKQDESLFHVSIGTHTSIINPNIEFVNPCVKILPDNKTRKKKKKTYNAKTLFKSKHTKELTTSKEENHIKINKKKRKICKVAKEKENKSGNTESLYFGLDSNNYKLHDQHTINTDLNEMSNNENIINTNGISSKNICKTGTNVLNYSKSKQQNHLKETTNILSIHDKKGKSINQIQKFYNNNDQNYSSISSKSYKVSHLVKNFEIKPCFVILNKDSIKKWMLMINKSKNIEKGDNDKAKENNNEALSNSVNITYHLPTNDSNFKENLICSTPMTTQKKRLACPILCSPINTVPSMKCMTGNTNGHAFDSKALFTSHTHVTNDINVSVNQPQQTDVLVSDQISVINSANTELCVNDNILYGGDTISHSLSSKNNMIDVQKQKLSHLESFESSVNFINNRERYDTVFMDDSIDLALRQNNRKTNLKNNLSLNVLSTSEEINRSRSLFNDSEIKLHSLTNNDSMNCDKLLTNTNAQRSNADTNLKLELSTLSIYNKEEIIKLKTSKEKESCVLITNMKEETTEETITKENKDIENECYSELHANQNQSDTNETNVFLAQIQDSVQVTKRKARVWKRNFNLSNIHENENDFVPYSTSKVSQCTEEANDHIPIQNHTKNLSNTSTNTATHYNSNNLLIERHTSSSPEKCIFLKPGKCWTRSLSILHNFQNGLNVNKISAEKGKKWRYSVQSILNMQKNDVAPNYREADKYNDKLQLCSETQIKTSDELSKKYNTDKSTLSKRFTRRISVRVIRDNKCTQNNDDISFLEVYGIHTNIKSESITSETNCTAKCNTEYNDDGDNCLDISSSKTAKEVVLQRCSQKNYLAFEECFPRTYLKYCQKIGEGVYGEVFLYKKDIQKSVLKIIPIEGDQLVNGEPQKKFSEILSEIVIAKELHNLRFSKVHNTSGFVEVKSIKCIKGKYPEEMVNLWKHYDDEKRSDNDCPSIFDENQLYITFELSHGGQDLEAFEFSTAFEAHTLFIQTALALAVAEKSFEFEHRDLHWGNILISHTDEQFICYKLDNKDIFLPSNGIKVCIIDFTLSRMLYQGCCIFNDLALDPVLFTAQGEYQFEIYRLMRNKIQNNWQEYEPYTNILWLHYILDKMVTIVRYKKKTLRKHKNSITMLQNLKEVILSYQSAFDFVNNCDQITRLMQNTTA